MKKTQKSAIFSHQAKLQSLSEIFYDQKHLAWEVLDSQSAIYSQTDTTLEKITYLTSLYMKIIEKLNTVQDPREVYFTYKMQKLMHEPYIIRCFNNQVDSKKNVLQDKKKEFEQKIEKQSERQNHKKVVQQAISAQEEKEKKMKDKIKMVIEQSNKKLDERIKRRRESRMMSPSKVSNHLGESSAQTISSDECISHEMGSSKQFELSIDENDKNFRRLIREIQEQQRQQCQTRKLLKPSNPPLSTI